MPFDHGSFSLAVFTLGKDLPEDYVALFAKKAAGTLDSVKDEPQIGFVSGRHLLDSQIDETTVLRGGFLHLAVRKAERKIPSALLNAICRREELAYMQANNLDFVPSKIKKQIKLDAVDKHLQKMPPQLAGIPFVIDPVRKLVYVGAASTAQLDLFIEQFYKALELEPIQLTPEMVFENECGTSEANLPVIMFTDRSEREPATGRDFLTWLWYYSENDNRIEDGDFGTFDVLVDGPLTFAYEGDASGAAETVVKKGESPMRSAEAKAALASGKKLKKAKLMFSRNDSEIWSGMYDADKFTFGSFVPPEGEAMDALERFVERMESLNVFQHAMRAAYRTFGKILSSPEWPAEEKKIKEWVAERESL